MENPFKCIQRILLVLIVTGAGSACSGIPTSNLRPSTISQTIYLSQPFEYESPRLSTGDRIKHTLSNGEYISKYENNNGTFYQGSPHCLSDTVSEAGSIFKEVLVGKKILDFECGIYIPNETSSPYEIFVINGSGRNFIRAHKDSATSSELTETSSQITQNIAFASPVQAEVGAGVAVGLIEVISNAENGRIFKRDPQPDSSSLRSAIKRK